MPPGIIYIYTYIYTLTHTHTLQIWQKVVGITQRGPSSTVPAGVSLKMQLCTIPSVCHRKKNGNAAMENNLQNYYPLIFHGNTCRVEKNLVSHGITTAISDATSPSLISCAWILAENDQSPSVDLRNSNDSFWICWSFPVSPVSSWLESTFMLVPSDKPKCQIKSTVHIQFLCQVIDS